MADYYKNDDDKIVNTEPTPLDPSPKVVVVENAETGDLAPSPKLEADVLVEGEQNKDAKIVGQAPIKSTIKPVKEMTYTDLVNVIKEVSESGDDSAVWGKITGNLNNQTDLKNVLDSLNVQVVELSNLSGTLSDSDYAKVSGNNCIIKMSTQYYYKEFDASTLISYKALPREGSSDDVILEKVVITKADKSWELITAQVGGANTDFTNTDLVAKTLSQTQANWELDIKSILNSGVVKDGTKLYAKLALVGNVLWVIISGLYTQGSATGSNATLINSTTIDIPDEIASKIRRADGTNLTEAKTSASRSSYIASNDNARYTSNLSSATFVLESEGIKSIKLVGYNFGNLTEDSEYWFDCRIPLLIL